MSILFRIAVAIWCAALCAPAQAAESGQASQSALEPNVEIASRWWDELTNVYTPVGWKNHLFRFNVLYNGTILAMPEADGSVSALAPWRGLGVQATFIPSMDGKDPYATRSDPYQLTTLNAQRFGRQGWTDDPAPVLWSEWRQPSADFNGLVLRQEVFAHIPGAKEIETGVEPLFAWIRMSVGDANPLCKPQGCGFLLKINAPHIQFGMEEARNATVVPKLSAYPRKLAAERIGGAAQPGCLLVEEGDKIRLGVLPGGAKAVKFIDRKEPGRDCYLHIILPPEKGATVDILLPMIAQARSEFMAEMSLGARKALQECNRYWSIKPATAAHVETPEESVNDLLRQNVNLAEVIAQKMPDSGRITNITGSLRYARIWATPTAMFDTMLLDTMGYHSAVEKYLEIFKQAQGSAKPPGPSYQLHPGYLCSPRSLESVDWLSDHGAVLHAICYHALVTDDRQFIAGWVEPILKACAFIKDARAIAGHDGAPGVLPPAVATDRRIPTQAVWNIGWNYKGLTSAVQLLQRIGHPRAEEFAHEARDFKETFVRTFHEAAAAMPRWTDARGQSHPIPPTSLSPGEDITHPFYLDTGPLFVVYAGLMDADAELMRSALAFFREGPNTRLFDPYGSFRQPPVLVREISSCEPCYSFNMFHSHQLGDRRRYLEWMYSMLAGAHSRQTYIMCETRGGITGVVGMLTVYGVRLCVVDDIIEPDSLHLLRLTPKAWLSTSRLTRFENMPTVFGPVSIRFQLAEAGKALEVSYQSKLHHRPKKVVLHTPPAPGLAKVTINGRSLDAKPGDRLEIE